MPETNYQQNDDLKGKVVKGNVKLEKKTPKKKILDFLFSDKIDSVGNYLAYSILAPSLKDMIFKGFTGALQMMLFGGNTVAQSPPPSQAYQMARRDPVPYNMYSNPGYAQPQPAYGYQRVTMNDISFDTKDDCYTVLDRMARVIQRYGRVRLADYYEACGITGQESNWALEGSGWYFLGDAHPIMRTDGRWVIEFPPIQSIR